MFQIEIGIARPVEEVFARLSDIESAPRWYSAVDDVTALDDGPLREGSRFRFTRHLAGQTAINEVAVSEYEPGRALALTSLSGPTPFAYRYSVAPAGDGTRLRLEGEISGDGLAWPLGMFKGVAESFFKRGMAENLKELKRMAEAA